MKRNDRLWEKFSVWHFAALASAALVILPLCACGREPAALPAADEAFPAAGYSAVQPPEGDYPEPRFISDAASVLTSDLDGDGASEAVSFRSVTDIDGAECLEICVTGADGSVFTSQLPYVVFHRAAAADLDPNDGLLDLLVCYDCASQDYETAVFRLCPDADGKTGLMLWGCEWGELESAGGGVLSLSSFADVMGRWRVNADFVIDSSTGTLERSGDYAVEPAGADAVTLTLKSSLPVRRDGRDETLPAGTVLAPVRADCYSYIVFRSDDGTEYTADVRYDYDNGTVIFIISPDGTAAKASEYFDFLPY